MRTATSATTPATPADLHTRLAAHRAGRGARLVAVITDAGIGFTLARLWPGEGRGKQRRLKRSGGASRYCPLCKAGGGA